LQDCFADDGAEKRSLLQPAILGALGKRDGDLSLSANSKTLFEKLKAQDRTKAAIHAIRHGIVHLE